MKLKTVLLPFATLVLCADVFTAPPSNASLERWLNTQNYDRDVEEDMIDSFDVALQLYAGNAVTQAPTDKRKQIAKAVDRYRENVLRGLITPKLKRKLRQTLLENTKTTLTQGEIDGIAASYGTPVGKSVLAKTPLFINKTMNKLMIGRPFEINDVTKRYLPEFEGEIQRIMCGDKNPHRNCTKPQQGKKAGSRQRCTGRLKIFQTTLTRLERKRPMEGKFLDILICPVTKGRLEYHQDRQESWSRQVKLTYPVRNGVSYMLEDGARALGEEELKA